jgi:hypothetical protein
MKSAAISELKATLSEILARVKAGEATLAKNGLVRLGSGKLPRGFWKLPRPEDKHGAGVAMLLRDRAEGR